MPTLLRIERTSIVVGASEVVEVVVVVVDVVEMATTEFKMVQVHFHVITTLPSLPLYDWPNKSDLFSTTFPPFSAEHRSDN